MKTPLSTSRIFLIIALTVSGFFFHANCKAQINDTLVFADELTNRDFFDSSIVVLKRFQNTHKDINSRDFLVSYRLLGENYMDLAQYDKADSVYQIGLSKASENLVANDPLVGDFYHSIGRNLGSRNRYDQSLEAEQKALQIRLSNFGDQHPSIAHCYNMISFSLRLKGQYDSALSLSQQAIVILENDGGDHERELSRSYFDIGWIYAAKGMYDESLQYSERALDMRRDLLGENHLLTGSSYGMVAFCNNLMGFTDQALENQIKILKIRQNKLGKEHVNVAASYHTISGLYHKLGEYKKAIDYNVEGNKIWTTLFGDDDRNLVRFYNQAANSYRAANQQKLAASYLKKAVKIGEEKLEQNHPELVGTYRTLASISGDQGNLNEQLDYLQKALQAAKTALSPKHPNIGHIKSDMAKNALSRKRGKEAIALQQEAISHLKQNFGDFHPSIADHYMRLGDILVEARGDLEGALSFYQQGLQSAIYQYREEDPSQNPRIEEVTSKLAVLKILARKSSTFQLVWGHEKNDLQPLEQALSTSLLALDLIDEIRGGYTTVEAKQQLLEDALGIYETALEISVALHNATGGPEYLARSFEISERSKSFILLNTLNDHLARQYAGIEDSLVTAEQKLKIEKAFYEDRLARARLSKNSERIALYETELFERKTKHDDLIRLLEGDFPEYHALKYAKKDFSYEKIKESALSNRSAIIEYFQGKNHLYTHLLTATGIKVFKQPYQPYFDSLILSFRKATTDYEFINQQSDLADSIYVKSASELYNLLLAPLLEGLGDEVQEITFILDGKLHHINFEALLLKAVNTKSVNYQKLPYLLNKYEVRYTHSAEYLSAKRKQNEGVNMRLFAGFAPKYTKLRIGENSPWDPVATRNSKDGRIPLPGAIDEVRAISQLLDGDTWIGNEANERNFKDQASRYKVLHMATHSQLNDQNPMLSELVFSASEDSINDGFLNIAEIYNLELNAELAILSACDTGVGEIQRGEGSISISRAFNYAGCPNIIMSLWKVPDNSTKDLMMLLYKNLKMEQPKAGALRAAKNQYLQQVSDPIKAHPYYWAGFVLTGDNEPMNLSTESSFHNWLWVAMGVLLLSVGTIFFLKSR